MTWRPRFTALFTQTALYTAAALLGLLVMARTVWASVYLSAALLLVGCLAILLLLLRVCSVLLICRLSRDTTTARIGASLSVMSLALHRQGTAFVLDASQISIRAIPLLVFSGIVITGGKSAARGLIAEVLGKFINYRTYDMGRGNG
jgi:hypothetical protein